MKKSKVVLTIVLAVIFILICINAPTFSWFTRPYPASNIQAASEAEGENMKLTSNSQYPVFNGYNVSMVTKSSPNGKNDSYNTTTTNYSGSGLGSFSKNYFCTTITNNSGYDQNVSLYISKLSIPTSNNGTLALGVNEPTRSYRDYTSLAEPYFTATNNMMRIYFEKDNSVSGWNGTEFYIVWNEDPNTSQESLDSTGSNGTYTKLQWVGDSRHPNHYYADIPRTATHAFFCVENWGTNNNGNANWGQRSQTLYNLASDGEAWNTPILYKITNTNSGSNKKVEHYTSPGVGIGQYYSSISVAAGNTFNAAPQSGWKIGGSVEYYSGDTGIFTVDSSGQITGVSAGEATLYTKVINDNNGYNDSMQVETTIKVTAAGNFEFNDVPIVKNLKIPSASGSNVVDVYWYVLNNSGSALTYTINRIYLGP